MKCPKSINRDGVSYFCFKGNLDESHFIDDQPESLLILVFESNSMHHNFWIYLFHRVEPKFLFNTTQLKLSVCPCREPLSTS